MFNLNVLANIAFLTQNLHIPLGNLLQSQYVHYVTLVYDNNTFDVATAASNAIKSAHKPWIIINADKALIASRYYKQSKKKTIAQDRDLIILTQNIKVSENRTYCFGSVLCSYLILVEKESIFYDRKNIRNIIFNIRYKRKWINFLAILLYSRMGYVEQLYFVSDNYELIHFDALQWGTQIYDRVFRQQYNIYRNYEPLLHILVGPFSKNIYKIKPEKLGGYKIDTFDGLVAGNYVYLANMIGRYLDSEVLISKQELIEFKKDSTESLALIEDFAKRTKAEKTYKVADEVLPYSLFNKR